MKRSRKQAARDRLMKHDVRDRECRKRNEAERALWIAIGGQVAWQRELDRQRRDRNERVRVQTRQVVEEHQRARGAQLALLWDGDAA